MYSKKNMYVNVYIISFFFDFAMCRSLLSYFLFLLLVLLCCIRAAVVVAIKVEREDEMVSRGKYIVIQVTSYIFQ